jgi:hypothetical protein
VALRWEQLQQQQQTTGATNKLLVQKPFTLEKMKAVLEGTIDIGISHILAAFENIFQDKAFPVDVSDYKDFKRYL